MSFIGKIISKVLSIFTGGEEEEPPPLPKVESPKTAPDPDNKLARRKNERKMQTRRAGQGRVANYLTDDSKLG